MSLFWRSVRPGEAEKRDTISEIGAAFSQIFGGSSHVDLSVADAALQDVAFHAATDLLASLASELPLNIYRGTGLSPRTAPIPDHLQDPSGDGYGREDWTYKLMASWLTRGNVYGDPIDYDSAGRPVQIDLFHPDRVNGWIEDGVVKWSVEGRTIPDMWHRRAYPFAGEVLGLSPVQMHQTDIGLAISVTRFGKRWFDDGAVPATVLQNEERALSAAAANTVKERFMSVFFGGSREPLILDRGWKFNQVQVAPEESQFLQTRGMSEAQVARIFGPGVAEILGYETGGNLTYSNRLDRAADLQTFTLNKWLKRVERVYQSMLPPALVPVIDRDALLETLTKDRFEAYNLATGGLPWLKPSEVRPREGLGPAPDLDTPQGGGPTGAPGAE